MKPQVLIAELYEGMQKVYRLALKDDAEAIVVSSPPEAYDIFTADPSRYHVIALGVNLQDMGVGLKTLKRITSKYGELGISPEQQAVRLGINSISLNYVDMAKTVKSVGGLGLLVKGVFNLAQWPELARMAADYACREELETLLQRHEQEILHPQPVILRNHRAYA